MRFRFVAALLWGAILLPTAHAAPAPAPAQSFGDWGVRCVPGSAPPCEMFQIVQDKSGRRLLGIAIEYLPRQDSYAIQLTTPLGVSFAAGARIAASALTVRRLPFRHCDKDGCYIEGAIERGALDSLGKSQPKAKVTITMQGGRAVDLPLSLNGFADARPAMEKLAREEKQAAPGPQRAPAR